MFSTMRAAAPRSGSGATRRRSAARRGAAAGVAAVGAGADCGRAGARGRRRRPPAVGRVPARAVARWRRCRVRGVVVGEELAPALGDRVGVARGTRGTSPRRARRSVRDPRLQPRIGPYGSSDSIASWSSAASTPTVGHAFTVIAEELGDLEGEVEGLAGVEAGVAHRLVSALELVAEHFLGSAETLGHVLAGELDVHAAGPDVGCPAHGEEAVRARAMTSSKSPGLVAARRGRTCCRASGRTPTRPGGRTPARRAASGGSASAMSVAPMRLNEHEPARLAVPG